MITSVGYPEMNITVVDTTEQHAYPFLFSSRKSERIQIDYPDAVSNRISTLSDEKYRNIFIKQLTHNCFTLHYIHLVAKLSICLYDILRHIGRVFTLLRDHEVAADLTCSFHPDKDINKCCRGKRRFSARYLGSI